MKTVIIWNEFGERDLGWFIVDGDYSELDRVYINSAMCDEDDIDKLNNLVYGDETGDMLFEPNTDFNLMPREYPIIVAGFLP